LQLNETGATSRAIATFFRRFVSFVPVVDQSSTNESN
jgi:hypothetical protein